MSKNVFLHEQVHKVTSGKILHYEVQIILILEWALQTDNPRVFIWNCQYISLLSRLHYFIFENHFAFFEFFDCNGIGIFAPAAQPDLTEGSFSDDFHGFEVIDGYFFTIHSELLRFLVRYLFFELLLFYGSHSEVLHFLIELLPILSFLLLESDHLRVALLDKVFGSLDFFFCGFAEGHVLIFIAHVSL